MSVSCKPKCAFRSNFLPYLFNRKAYLHPKRIFGVRIQYKIHRINYNKNKKKIFFSKISTCIWSSKFNEFHSFANMFAILSNMGLKFGVNM